MSVGNPGTPAPDGFCWQPLSELARLESGHTPSRGKPEYWDGDVPWIGIRDASGNHGRVLLDTQQHVTQLGLDNSSARLLPAGTVCLSRTASVGFVVTMGRPMATSQDFVNWVCGPELDHRYLHYLLMSEQETIRRIAYGSVHPTMYYPDAKALHVCVPSLRGQQAIAEVLGALDDKIAANTQAARTADELIEAHYAAAIAVEGASSQLLFDVLDIVFGEAFKGDSFSEPGVGRPLIRIRDLKTASPQVWTTEARPRETLILPGDVVVGMDAEFRASWWLGEPGLLNQRVLRATAKHASTAFAAMALKRPLSALEGEKSATTVIHLNKSDLARSSVMVPGAGALARFDAVAEPIRLARVALALESRKLAVTRDELLPLLMSGKVRIKEAEKTMERML